MSTTALARILYGLRMKPHTALPTLAAALGATQLVGAVITTPDIMTSNATFATFSLPGQRQIPGQTPTSSITELTTLTIVEPPQSTSPQPAPVMDTPGHVCQITSHCPWGAESYAAFEAFKAQVGDVPGYCSFLSFEVSRRLGAGNGTAEALVMDGAASHFTWPFTLNKADGGSEAYFVNAHMTSNQAKPGAVDSPASDACGLAADASAYPLYASLFAYQFCVAANQSDSLGQVMSRYAAADLPAWDAPTVEGGGLTAMVGFYISSRSGDMGPGCEAYGLLWAGGIQDGSR